MANVNEIWKPCFNYENKYEVSNTGKVRKIKTKRELIGHISISGYKRVSLSKDNKNINRTIHRLVIQSFIGNIPNKVVNHKNGIKTDNRLENLEWVTISENTKHSFDNCLQVNKKGLESPFAKMWVHKEYGFFLTTVELYDLYGTNGVNKKPMEIINFQYSKL
jgi:phosphomevalonate kinase